MNNPPFFAIQFHLDHFFPLMLSLSKMSLKDVYIKIFWEKFVVLLKETHFPPRVEDPSKNSKILNLSLFF